MAATVQITDRGRTAMMRNPWAVLLFTVIMMGVSTSCGTTRSAARCLTGGEQNDLDIGMSPGLSVLAVTLGGILVVPAFVSIWGTGKRMQLTWRAANVQNGSGLL